MICIFIYNIVICPCALFFFLQLLNNIYLSIIQIGFLFCCRVKIFSFLFFSLVQKFGASFFTKLNDFLPKIFKYSLMLHQNYNSVVALKVHSFERRYDSYYYYYNYFDCYHYYYYCHHH
jgi:hypothetical protein